MFLFFPQTPKSKFYVEMLCILTCLSHLPKVYFSFLGFVFCVITFWFSSLWRSYKFFPKNLFLFHFMWKFHHIPFPHFMSQHFTSHLSNASTFFPSLSSSACACNPILHFYFHSSHFPHSLTQHDYMKNLTCNYISKSHSWLKATFWKVKNFICMFSHVLWLHLFTNDDYKVHSPSNFIPFLPLHIYSSLYEKIHFFPFFTSLHTLHLIHYPFLHVSSSSICIHNSSHFPSLVACCTYM